MTIASQMFTRRSALLGAGALLLAGCGPPEAAAVDAREVWQEQLRASQEALMAYPPSDKLRRDAEQRTILIGAALEKAGGVYEDRTSGRVAASALAGEQAALRAHVAAVGLLGDAASRTLLAELIDGTAGAVAALAKDSTSFPGGALNPR